MENNIEDIQTNVGFLGDRISESLTKPEIKALKAFSEKVLHRPYKGWMLDMMLLELREAIEEL